MPGDIGPGPLICVEGFKCTCGDGVNKGALYQCVDLHELSFIEEIMYGGCLCEEQHPWICLKSHSHIYCPRLFVPLGDPDAEIRETSEPISTRVHPMHRIKEPQDA